MSLPSSESSIAPSSKRRLICGQSPGKVVWNTGMMINFIHNISQYPLILQISQHIDRYIAALIHVFILINWHPVYGSIRTDVLQGRGHIRLRGAWPSWAAMAWRRGVDLEELLGLPAGNGGSAATRGRKHCRETTRTHIVPWGSKQCRRTGDKLW